jgi:hypothetical protein
LRGVSYKQIISPRIRGYTSVPPTRLEKYLKGIMANDPVKDPTPEPLFKGPRAGNTTQTLAPKTVNVLDPPDWRPKEEIYGPDGFPSLEQLAKQSPKMFRAPVIVKKPDSLEMRVMKLEDRLDSLLDRLARYNVKSSHKI